MGVWGPRMSVVSKLPGYHLIAKMKSKLGENFSSIQS